MVAYSMPMTPAPTTVRLRGTRGSDGDVVAVEDVGAVERNVCRAERRGADGDNDFVGLEDDPRLRAVLDADAMRIEEIGDGRDGLDAVAGELVLQHVDLVVERHAQARAEILALDVLLDAVGEAVEAALAPAREVEHRLAQRLGRDGAGVDRNAADPQPILDHQHRCRAWRPGSRRGGRPARSR